MKTIIFSGIIMILFACSSQPSNTTYLDIPTNNIVILGARNNYDIYNKERRIFRICTYIDTNCSLCLQDLNYWGRFITENSLSEIVDVIVFVNNDYYNAKELEDWLIGEKKLNNIRIIYDKDNQYLVNNILTKYNSTFLLDSNNKILNAGNPIKYMNVKKEYLKILKVQKTLR